MEELKTKIDELRSTLTGDLFADMETQQEIYELKKQLSALQGITIEEYEANDDEGCIYCSG